MNKRSYFLLIWSTISKVHESLNYIIFMHLKENIPLNEYDKTIIQKSIPNLFHFLVLTEPIAKNTLSTLVATSRSNTN